MTEQDIRAMVREEMKAIVNGLQVRSDLGQASIARANIAELDFSEIKLSGVYANLVLSSSRITALEQRLECLEAQIEKLPERVLQSLQSPRRP